MRVLPDEGYLRFRRNNVRLASGASLFVAALTAVYALAGWGDEPHRGGLLALAGFVTVAVVAVEAGKAERLVETRWCDVFFGVWSSLYVALIVVMAALDGGVTSPLALTFFPVLVFAGLCYPLRLAAFIGLSCVVAHVALGVFTEGGAAEEEMYVAGLLVLTAIMCAWQASTLERQRRELATASRTDYLTGCLNRRGFHEHAERVLERARRSGEPAALILVDLDGFKGVNDRLGHAAGDEVLAWVADRLRAGLRPTDTAARLGGDEFALLLPGLEQAQAAEVAERLRATLGERVAASFGVSGFALKSDADTLLADADGELYRDKSRRRSPAGLAPAEFDLPR